MIDAEKLAWFEEVGIKELKKPFTHVLLMGAQATPSFMYYSNDYLKNTPLDVLKQKHEKHFKRNVCFVCETRKKLKV